MCSIYHNVLVALKNIKLSLMKNNDNSSAHLAVQNLWGFGDGHHTILFFSGSFAAVVTIVYVNSKSILSDMMVSSSSLFVSLFYPCSPLPWGKLKDEFKHMLNCMFPSWRGSLKECILHLATLFISMWLSFFFLHF